MMDLHCHIDLYENPAGVLEACDRKKMYILSVTTTPSAWEKTNALSSQYRRTKTALGLHPQLAKEREFELPLFDMLLPRTKYVGEIGLDGTAEYEDSWESQHRVFSHILNSCKKNGGRIMSIHSRGASREVIDCLVSSPKSGIPILHWFSGSVTEVYEANRIGCFFSINPLMSRSKKGQELIRHIPKEKVLLESDRPFTVFNKKPLLPWDVGLVISDLCGIWLCSEPEAVAIIDENFQRLLSQINGSGSGSGL